MPPKSHQQRKHPPGNPRHLKQKLDEESYGLADWLYANLTLPEVATTNEETRKVMLRRHSDT